MCRLYSIPIQAHCFIGSVICIINTDTKLQVSKGFVSVYMYVINNCHHSTILFNAVREPAFKSHFDLQEYIRVHICLDKMKPRPDAFS